MKKEPVKPHLVQERLSRDVHAILSVCIQHFDDSGPGSKEQCFDVDAVISGRSVADALYARRVKPARYARAMATSVPSTLSIPQKGYFIPSRYASHLSFA